MKMIMLISILIAFIGIIFIMPTAYAATFTNPIVADGQDPWVITAGGYYFYCYADGASICVRKSATLQGIGSGTRSVIFTATSGNPYSNGIWAPELHYVDGRWYCYFAATDAEDANHRMFVLQGGTDPDKPLAYGTFDFIGQLVTPGDRWSIDGTVFKYNNQLYFVWSGWEGTDKVRQNIYIAAMSNPYTISGDRVMISTPDQPWETVSFPDVNEGPEVLMSESTVHVIYSASGSWMDDYCLGRLTCTNGNIMDSGSWAKTGPVFAKTDSVYGPGHCSFVKSPDGIQNWIVYHAAKTSGSGWDRNVRIQQFDWNGSTPIFGIPITAGIQLDEPSKGNSMPLVSNGIYKLTNKLSSLCLDVVNGGTVNGTEVQQWTDNGRPAQCWQFVSNGAGYYKIYPQNAPDKCLVNSGGSTTEGTLLKIWDSNNNDAQLWRVEKMGNGYYRIVNKASSLCLNNAGGSMTVGNRMNQYRTDGTNAQVWKIDEQILSSFQVTALAAQKTENKMITASTEIKNNMNTTNTVNVILALYDEEETLQDLQIEKVAFGEQGSKLFTKQLNNPADLSYYKVKVMIWDENLDKMIPYAESKTLSY